MGDSVGLSGSKVVFVYYAHPIWMYDTPEEEDAIKRIKTFFGENAVVINPSDYEKIESYRKMKKEKGIDFCLKLIDDTEYLVFQRFTLTADLKSFIESYVEESLAYLDIYRTEYLLSKKERIVEEIRKLRMLMKKDSVVTPGVSKEVNYTLKKNIPVYELADKEVRKFEEKVLHEDIQQPNRDTLYGTLSKIIDAFKSQDQSKPKLQFPCILTPPFWWLFNQ